MYTHCPNCNTHFSITQEYLDIANGKVRCGKCDHVFNALENLYNNQEQPSSPQLETATTSTADDDSTAPQSTGLQNSTTEPPPEEGELTEQADANISVTPDTDVSPEEESETPYSYTPPLASIDIKKKMERIAASLSAATQELKNARKSVGFEKGDSEFIKADEQAENTDTLTELETPAEQTETEPSADFEPSADLEPSAGIEPSADIEPSVESDIEPSLPEESSTDLATEEPLPDTSETQISEDSTDESAAEEAEPPALADELDLVDFSEQIEDHSGEDISHQTPTDYKYHSVDESDIDILNSLIDAPEQTSSAPGSIIEELNDINKSLSDNGISLDEELDNNNDIQNELEQLEQEIENTGATTEDFLNDDLDTPAAEIDDDLAIQQSSVNTAPKVQEEVVPSFLNQNQSSSSSPAIMFGWLFATLIMLSLLALQYLHFNSLKLADDPDFRPFLETLCPLSGCALPLRKAPEEIITISHDVHTHPSVKDALEIQLSFKNKAAFTQEYPTLEVIFSNPRGEVIARRKFSPDEYLNNSLEIKTPYIAGMKPSQTQKVDLQIVDPDPGALLSFQFNYL